MRLQPQPPLPNPVTYRKSRRALAGGYSSEARSLPRKPVANLFAGQVARPQVALFCQFEGLRVIGGLQVLQQSLATRFLTQIALGRGDEPPEILLCLRLGFVL